MQKGNSLIKGLSKKKRVVYLQHMIQKRLGKEEEKAERVRKQAKTKENNNSLGKSG